MNWLFQLHTTQPVAHAIGALALVSVVGMALGSCKVRGVGLGTAGVLFAGIVAGHFGKPVDHATLDFVKEFGLILFVFTIGLQLGPGFFATLRQQGLRLNGLAAGPKFFTSVFSSTGLLWLGAGLCVTVLPLLAGGLFARGVLKMNFTTLSGLLAGSVTDPPALAFANNLAKSDAPTLAYATVYPLTMLLRILCAQVLTLTLVR